MIMRLREMLNILNENEEYIYINATTKQIGSSEYKEIKFSGNLYSALENIKALNFIDNEIKELIGIENNIYSALMNPNNPLVISSNSYNRLFSCIKAIREKIYTVRKVLLNAIPEQDPNSISIKLPSYDDFDKLPTFFKELDTSLNLIFSDPKLKTSMKIQNFDSGSLWVEITFGASSAVLFFGSIIKIVAKASEIILNHKKTTLEIEKATQSLKQFKTDNDRLNDLKDDLAAYQKTQIKLLTIEQLSADSFNIDNQESINSITMGIENLAKLQCQGAEYKPALNAPVEITESFPDNTELISLKKQLLELESSKLLTENNDTLNNSDSSDDK